MTDPPPPPRKPSRWRWIVLPVLLLALPVGGLFYLVVTPSGARTLARLALRWEPRLSLQVKGGTLWRGLQLSEMAWTDGPTRITLGSLDARWRVSISPRPALDFQRIHADRLRIHLPSGPEASRASGEPASFHLPFHLAAADVQLRNVRLRINDLSIGLQEASLAGTLHGKDLNLDSLHLRDVVVTDRRPVTPPPAVSVPWFELLAPARRSPIALPDIHIPLDFRVDEFALDRASYTRGDATRRVQSLRISAGLADQMLTVDRLELDADQGQLRGKGQLQLSGTMPLDVKLYIATDTLLPRHPLKLEIGLANSLEKLAFTVRLDGPGTIEASGVIHPLDPRLPLNGSLVWANLAWPLEGALLAASKSGTVKFDGSLESYALDLDGDLLGTSIPEGHWTLQAQGTLHQLTCNRLQGELLGGSLHANGAILWTNGLAWDMELNTEAINGALLHDSAPSNLTGHLRSKGQWQAQDWKVGLDIQAASANWQTHPFSLQGKVAGSSKTGWKTPGLTVGLLGNTLHITGTLAEELGLAGEIHLPQPETLVTDLTGTLDGTWSLTGSLLHPDAVLSLQASNLAFRDQARISAARLEATIANLAIADSHLQLEIDSLSFPDQTNSIETLRLVAAGTRANHQVSLEAEGSPVDLSFSLQGALDESTLSWAGEFQHAALSIAEIHWTLTHSLPVRWDSAARQLTVAPHRWQHNQAEFLAVETLVLGTEGNAQIRLAGFDLAEFHPWLPEKLRIKGTLGASADLQWADGSFRHATASLEIQQGAVRLIRPPSDLFDDAPPIDIACETIRLDSQLVTTNWSTRLVLTSDYLGTARAEAHIGVATNHTLGNWSGQVELDGVKLEILSPFLTSLRTFSGELDASIRLSGNPRHPLLHGTISLTNGVVEPLDWPLRLGDIHLRGNLNGERADLSGGFRSGDGLGTLNGQWEITDNAWEASLQLSGDRLDLSYDTFVVFQASPDLTLRIAPGHLYLAGTILVPQADITVQKLPDSAVKTSADALVIQPAAGGKTNGVNNGVSTWSRNIDIQIQLGDKVALSGYGITSHLAGQLRIRQTDAATPSGNGEIRIETGKFNAYGQKLSIRTGQFLFAGPLNRPTLYVEAVREVPDDLVTVGLRVEGPIDALRTSLFSQPTMPDEQILPYLLLGRPLERGDGGATDGMLASAALSLGLAQSRGRATSMAESVGIDDFQVGAQGSGDGTEIVVSGTVSPRLQVSYGGNVYGSGTTLTLRYRLAKNLFLESVTSLVHSLELLYSFAY